ncbi:MAG: PAS domain S-box protein [Cyclobacteriaceae bacterium]
MGELTRNFNWAETALGSPELWPESLRLTVSMILSSKFPMFLWWGEELIQFYNDAYRPSLGNNGKHPLALGQKGKDCWPEIWDIIYPLIQRVRDKHDATWSEDQLIPIYRNGKIEDVYWTFGYSPIFGESRNVEGILVVCIETTEKVETRKAIEESEQRFRTMADNIPNLAWMANADGWIFWYNKKWYEYTGTTSQEMEGWGWQSVHDPKELPQVLTQWQSSIASGQPFDMIFPLRGSDGKFRKFLTRVLPVYNNEGKIYQWFGTNTDVMERMEAEQSLKESEERFRTMAEGSGILIATSDETSHLTYVNKAWVNLTGRSMEELLNFGWLDLLHPQDKDGFLEIYLKAFEKRESWTGEFRILNKKGAYRWLLAKAPVRLRPDGTFAGYISSSVDITEHKNAEKKLQESEQRVRSVVESAPFPIGVYVGRDMRIELANQAIMDVIGKGHDIIGKSYMEILPELKNQGIFQNLEKVFLTGIPFHAKNQRVEIVENNKIKSYYFNYSFTPLVDSSGMVYGVMNTAADVTELNLAKLKIQENEENLRNTILQAPVAMCIYRGPDHVVELANDRMFEFWGKNAEAVLHKPIFVGLPEAKDQGFEAILNGVYKTGKAYSAQGVPVSLPRNGNIKTVYVNFVYEPFREPDGSVSGILAVAIDVTAQVIAHQKIEEVVSERTSELANANNSLQKSNAELAQFAYIASHDLQEPLRKIRTFSQMLENSMADKLDDHSRNLLDKIDNSASRMHTLIKDVLKYSELVKENELFVEVNLNEVIKSIQSDFDLLIEQKGATIKYENLPTLQAIPLQMSQLFGNIIGNSLKFSRNGIKPVINITASRASKEELKNLTLDPDLDYRKIQFDDNGIGFQKEYAEQIFNIFQRLHRKSEYEGTGIGLALCKKIVINHRGHINATGSTENGAVFNIILPVKQVKR